MHTRVLSPNAQCGVFRWSGQGWVWLSWWCFDLISSSPTFQVQCQTWNSWFVLASPPGNKCFLFLLSFYLQILPECFISIWFGKLLFPLHVSYQANIMHPSQHGKLWDQSLGSNPSANSLHGISGPSPSQAEMERNCKASDHCLTRASLALRQVIIPQSGIPHGPWCSDLTNPHDFSLCVSFHFVFLILKQKPCLRPLRLDWQTAMSSFFALDLDLSTYCDHTWRLLVTQGKKTGKRNDDLVTDDDR